MRPDTTTDVHPGAPSARQVLGAIVRRPWILAQRWNWKSAVVSSLIRATIFFTANLPSGRAAAWAAFATEVWLRLATSGFYGGLTQELGRIEPAWQAMVAAMIVLPLLSHGLEIIVHLLRGTPELVVSILASVVFTVLSTSFNVFAMRRGALITGIDSQPLHRDLARMPHLIACFIGAPFIALFRWISPTRSGEA